jgi:hypothetical protein
MNKKLKKLTFLAAVLSICSTYLIGRAQAEEALQARCELPRKGTVIPAELTKCTDRKDYDNPARYRGDDWNGRFKFVVGQDEHGRYERAIAIACETDSNCTAQQSLHINGKEVPESPIFDGSNPTPIPSRLPFNLDEMISTRFRRNVLDFANATDFPHAAAYFEPGTYRQIGTPNHVVECRANILLIICKLDAALVRDDYGRLTAWIILFPDLSSGPGCPGVGCPHALTKEDPNMDDDRILNVGTNKR